MSSKSATEPATPEVHREEVVLRLDYWHDYMFGQQKELNQQLAKEFEKHNLTAWEVSAADTAGRHIAGNDTLVPISVRIQLL
jgi:putative SOS response-associated peptidase YedK